MNRQSHYNINVARYMPQDDERYGKRHVHLFDTGDTLLTETDAQAVYTELVARFPEPEFRVTVTHWEVSGRHIGFNLVAQERTSDGFLITSEPSTMRPGLHRAKIAHADTGHTAYLSQWAWLTPQEATEYARLVWAGHAEGLRDEVYRRPLPRHLRYALEG